jgi:hypothetical protein
MLLVKPARPALALLRLSDKIGRILLGLTHRTNHDVRIGFGGPVVVSGCKAFAILMRPGSADRFPETFVAAVVLFDDVIMMWVGFLRIPNVLYNNRLSLY